MDGKIYGNRILDQDIQKLLILSWLQHGIGRLIMYPKMECKGDGNAKVQGGNKGFIEASEVNGLANDRRIGHFSHGDRLLSLKKALPCSIV